MRFYIFLFLLLPISGLAQKHDNIWLFGFEGGNQTPLTDSFGITILDFSGRDGPRIIEDQTIAANFYGTNASICDSTGRLLFYTNGENIYSYNHKIMSNGLNISTNGTGFGYSPPQGAIALPLAGKSKLYALLSLENEYLLGSVYGWNLFYHEIDMSKNGGLGMVTKKRRLLLQDTLTYGTLSATKHANGRDWWFVVLDAFSRQHYIGLVTPQGIRIDTFKNNIQVRYGLGQSIFSPDGTKYIRADDEDLLTPNEIGIYDFDRCTGRLSNFRTKSYPGLETFGTGCVVSPDSRYLYVMCTYVCYQYDLQADDIFATETVVAEWDSTKYFIWPTDFYLGQIGPDGRIYVNTTNGSTSMHRINFPNRPGAACGFEQNAILTHTIINFEMPNFPNYRLGPLDGSPCDTLGLNNRPLAHYRWEQEDKDEPLRVSFTDLSAYEPASWHWDFGDGSSSQDTNPVHTFAKPELYRVCLTVRNANSSDSLCRWIPVGVSNTHTLPALPQARVSPNPATDYLRISLPALLPAHALRFALTDVQGRVLREVQITDFETDILVYNLPRGLYFWQMKVDGEVVQSGKIVKAEADR